MTINNFLIISLFFFLTATQTQAVDLTCTSKIGGSWSFGTAPSACNVSPLMTQDSVKGQYATLLFDDSTSSAASERKTFLSEMYPLLREVGTAYLVRENPSVTQAELNGFLDGLYALAHQETYWTHYRNGKDQLIRYMRGDNDHGHGLMQVDDRSHQNALQQGRGVDLVYNIVYGLDVYYAAWKRSATASCVSSATNYKTRARASWSAYNGGPSKICRWSQSPTAGDTGYVTKYDQRKWLDYVQDTQAPVAVDVNCLMFNTRPCLAPGTPIPPPPPLPEDPNLHELIGKTVTLVAPNGINLRDLVTNKVLLLIPRGTKVVVEDVTQKDSDIKTYIKVTYKNKTGSLYAGHEKPTNTRPNWIRVEASGSATLATNRPYKFLRKCPNIDCSKTSNAIKGGSDPDILQIISKDNKGWVEVQIAGTPDKGWIELSDLTETRF